MRENISQGTDLIPTRKTELFFTSEGEERIMQVLCQLHTNVAHPVFFISVKIKRLYI